MPQKHETNGVVKLIKAMRGQSKKVYEMHRKSNMLGTITAAGIVMDGIDEEIPKSEFSILKTEIPLKTGDRVTCIPVGDYFVVIGKVE